MRPTKNDIPLAKRTKLVPWLNQLLSDSIDLKLQTKQAHWNVKGENFIALHELFDKVAAEVEEAVDMIAERVVQLGGTALGTTRVVAKQSRLEEYPLNASEEQEHVEALSSALAAFNAMSRQLVDETASLGDAITADLLTEITRGLDKQLWFIESHLKKLTSRALKAGHA
jgi:starvation-inducible DNA-binding protein